MKAKLFFLPGFLISLLALFFWQQPFCQGLLAALQEKVKILSPLSQNADSQVLGEITTLENNLELGQNYPGESVLGKGVLVYDLGKKKIVFEKDSRQKLAPASTIKIITAAIALEKGKLDEEITVNYFPTMVGESSMNLAFGEKFSLQELLYGLLVVSGNDAAETIAQGLAGKREIFVAWMNDFAAKAGAKETNFKTPSGLEEADQYTTTFDLFLMARMIYFDYPQVLQICATREKYFPASAHHRAYLLKNKLLLSGELPILTGKPGLGEEGLSLVAVLEKNQQKYLAVIIQTPSLKHDITEILKII